MSVVWPAALTGPTAATPAERSAQVTGGEGGRDRHWVPNREMSRSCSMVDVGLRPVAPRIRWHEVGITSAPHEVSGDRYAIGNPASPRAKGPSGSSASANPASSSLSTVK